MKQALYQKYRPKDFSEAIGQDKIVQTLRNALKSGRVGHAYLFAGQRGTGKTTYARILAQSLNCQNLRDGSEPCFKCQFCLALRKGQAIDIIEIDAASNRGIDEIRDLKEKIRFAPTLGKYKVYIIDEVHMLTKEAFNALLKTLEEPPAHVVFIMATTEAHKLPATILSRVQRFDFGRIPVSDILKNLRHIAKEERIDIDDSALSMIAGKADGSHRDAISLLEQIKSYATKISAKEVGEVLGLVGSDLINQLLDLMLKADRKAALARIENHYQAGFDLGQLAVALVEVLRGALFFKSGILDQSLLATEVAELKKLAVLTSDQLICGIEQFSQAVKDTKSSAIQSLPLELAVLTIIDTWGVDGEPPHESTPLRSSPFAKATDDKSSYEGQANLTKVQINNQDTRNPSTSSHSSLSEEAHPSESKTEPLRGKTQTNSKIQISNDKSKQKSEDQSNEATVSLVACRDERSGMKQSDNGSFDEKTWKEILDRIKSQNHTLQALLRDIKPLGVVDGKLQLCAKFKFHKDKILEIKNRQLVEQIIHDVTGQKLAIFCDLAENLPKNTTKISEDELLTAAEEVFS